MTDDLQRLIVSLEVRDKAFLNAMNKLNGTVNQRVRAIESRFDKMGNRVGNTMAGVGKRWIAGIVAAFGTRELTQLSDAATKIDNALKIAGLSGVELEGVYGKLRDSAVKNAAPLEALVELYSRAALVQKDLGKTSEELTTFADKVAVALRVGGRSAAESSGALLQLSQALGEGIVRAQEFNSIIEGAPALLQAAAAGIKQADGSVAKLRAIMLDGGLSSKAFFDGIVAGAPLLEDKIANAEYTISQAMGNLRTGLIDAAREFNNTTGASSRLAGGINNVAEAITDLDVTGFIEKIQSAQGAFEKWAESVGNSDVFLKLNQAMGVVDDNGLVINFDKEEAEAKAAGLQKNIETLQERIRLNTKLELDNTEALARLGEVKAALAAVTAQAAGMPDTLESLSVSGSGITSYVPSGGPTARNGPRRKVAVDAIDLEDNKYKPPPDSSKKGGRAKVDDYAREVAQIKERTAAIQAETAAQKGLCGKFFILEDCA
jgi:tape measure domain-containing protein